MSLKKVRPIIGDIFRYNSTDPVRYPEWENLLCVFRGDSPLNKDLWRFDFLLYKPGGPHAYINGYFHTDPHEANTRLTLVGHIEVPDEP